MTGIVIATVIIFAALVGGTDYILSLGVKQAVAAQAAAATPDSGGNNRPSSHRTGRNSCPNRRPNCVAVAVVGE